LSAPEKQFRLMTHRLLSLRESLVFVRTPDADAERSLAAETRAWLGDRCRVVDGFLAADAPETLRLSHHLQPLPPDAGQTALFLYGLDDLPDAQRAATIEGFNWTRGQMRGAGYGVTIWIRRPETLAEIGEFAPDFYSWRGGLFEFEPPDDAAERREWFTRLATFAPTTTRNPLAETRRRYLDYVIESFRWLEFRGLLQMRNVVRLPLAKVFVPLRAQGRERVARPDFDAEQFQAEGGDARRFRPAFERMAFQTVESPLHEVARRSRRVVVLGDPGSGKSTALRFLALAFAEGTQGEFGLTDLADARRLPILVPLSAYAEARRAQPDLPLAEFLPRHFSETLKVGDFSALFAEALRTGDAVVFLDGLDEMLTFDDRAGAMRAVAEFAAAHPNVRIMLSSRIAGYVGGALPGDFETVTLAPFDRAAIETFAKNWALAFEAGEADADALSDAARQRAQKRGENLAAAVIENPNVERLATNPLMLTLLALIHHQGTRLPNRRVDLYRLCVEALAETWNLARNIEGKSVPVRFLDRPIDENFVVRTLAPVAFWMHTHKPTGVITRAELETQLTERFEAEGYEPDRAAALAREFTDLIREQLGLLVERAPDEFRFLHLTIEEYLTARHLVAQGEEELMREVHSRRHHPRWQEPIQLALAFLSGSSGATAGRVIKTAILAQEQEAKRRRFKPSRYETVLHRDLIFAVFCLADCVGVPSAPRCAIVGDFTKLYLSLHGENSNRQLSQKLSDGFVRLGKSDVPEDAVPALLAALRDLESKVRARAAEALGNLNHAAPDVISALAAALRDPEAYVRACAAEALGNLNHAAPDVIADLRTALHDPDSNVRAWAVSALRRLGADDHNIIPALHTALRNPDSEVRASAAEALGRLGYNDDDIRALRNALCDPDSDVRTRAAEALIQLGHASPDVISALLNTLRDSEPHLRARAAAALGQLAHVSPDVIAALHAALRDSAALVRCYAADAIGKLGNASPDVIAALRDSAAQVRFYAAYALGQLSQASPDIITALLHTALRDSTAYVRAGAIDAIGKLGSTSPDVIAALHNALRDPQWNVRACAVAALGQLGDAGPDTYLAIFTTLHDPDRRVRASAAQALADLCTNDQSLSPLILENIARTIRKTLHAKLKGDSYFVLLRGELFRNAYDAVWDALWTICQALEERAAS
jgi:HEAT repeat protein